MPTLGTNFVLGSRGFLADLLQRLQQGLQNQVAAASQIPADFHPGFDPWGLPFTPTPSSKPADLGWSPSPIPSNKPSPTPADYHPGYDPWGRPFTTTTSPTPADYHPGFDPWGLPYALINDNMQRRTKKKHTGRRAD